MVKVKSVAAAIATVIGISGLLIQPIQAAGAADFYKGKTVSITVAGSAGASLGLYCRLVAAPWGAHIPGNPNVICQFKPGGGGTKGAAWVYNKAKYHRRK